jgi:polar amino acid transport system substrate-binding protein
MKVAATECEGRPSEYGSNLDDRRWGMQASLPDTLWGQQRKTGPDVERCIDAEVSSKPAWRAVNPSEETMTPCKSATEFIRGSFAVMGIASLTWLLTSAAMAAEVTPPAEIASAGKIVYCSDISGPPLGYFDENNKPIGSDIDLGTEIARRLGVKAEFANTPFDGIIPALQAKHCDAIISQLFDKPKRREVVDFVDYMNSSQALLVHKGNPKNVHGLDDLSGLKIAVENGTTIQSLIDEQNKKFAAAGKPPANIVVYPKDTDALQALQIKQVDVYGTTLESAAYYMQKAADTFDVGGEPFAKILTGIAVRKGDTELRDAIQKAFDNIKADGTYLKILSKWHLEGDQI